MAAKHWRIATAARQLGEPVERTQERVDNWELPAITRNGEQLVSVSAVLALRERLMCESSPPLTLGKEERAQEAREQHSHGKGRMGDEPREFSARTVAEAIGAACSALGVAREDLVYEIRDPGLGYVLGLSDQPATIAVLPATPSSDPSVNERSGGDAVPSANEKGTDVAKAFRPVGVKSTANFFYSLGQASIVLKTTAEAVKAMVTRGKLRAELIGGHLWFPSEDFEAFVIREHGRERLSRAPSPYPASKIRHTTSDPSKSFNVSSIPSRPVEGLPHPSDSAKKGREPSTPADRRSGQANTASEKRSAAEEELRLVTEAARRFGTSMAKVRRRVSAGQLVYDPIGGMLVEGNEPKTPNEKADNTGKSLTERPAGRFSGEPESRKVSSGYLTVAEAACELDESVVTFLGRIGKKQLKAEKRGGKVVVWREDVIALKEGTGGTRSQEASKPRTAGGDPLLLRFQGSVHAPPVSASLARGLGDPSPRPSLPVEPP
ncbi:MAG: Jag N-terminal domain-containing protein, partial [Actinomycetota bacterium]|nr:Jag N-terminal domain-containing protein [Actinomycetota bacterium]